MRELPFDQILDEVASGRAERRPADPRGPADLRRVGAPQGARPRRVVAGRDRPAAAARRQRRPRATSATARRTSRRCSREAIRVGLDHRDEALAYAEGFGRGIDRETADRFVAMYVNELTCDYGDVGRRAVDELLRRSGTGVSVYADGPGDVAHVTMPRPGDGPGARGTAGRSSPPGRSPRRRTPRSSVGLAVLAPALRARYDLSLTEVGRGARCADRSARSATLYPWGRRRRPLRRASRRHGRAGTAAASPRCASSLPPSRSFECSSCCSCSPAALGRQRQLGERARGDALVRRARPRARARASADRGADRRRAGRARRCRRSSLGATTRGAALLALAGAVLSPARSSGSLVLRERPERGRRRADARRRRAVSRAASSGGSPAASALAARAAGLPRRLPGRCSCTRSAGISTAAAAAVLAAVNVLGIGDADRRGPVVRTSSAAGSGRSAGSRSRRPCSSSAVPSSRSARRSSLLVPALVLMGCVAISWNGTRRSPPSPRRPGTRAAARALGLQQTALAVAGSILPIAFGALVAATSWRAGFVAAALFPLAGRRVLAAMPG